MPRTRHRLAVAGLAGGVVLGVAAPAQAQLSRSTALPAMSVATGTVAPPTGLSTGGTKCVTTYDAWTGTYSSSLQARVSWTASGSRGVSGYVVTAHFADGSTYPVTSVGATTTSVSGSYDIYYASQNIKVSVRTLTSYGWTAESALSKAISC